MAPLVSIIVSVYNEENYLVECMESLISQTLKEIEIIVVDDASTDSSKKIIEKYVELDSRIKPFFLKTNVGLSSARNTGLSLATGKYIGFVDSDDFVDKNMFEKMYQVGIEWGSDIVSSGHKKYENNRVVSEHPFPISSTSNINHNNMLSLLARGHQLRFIWFVWRNIYKREMLQQNQINFNEEVRFAEDSVFNFYAFYHSKKTTVISEQFYYYRATPDSLTSKKGKVYLEENLVRQYQDKLRFYSRYNFKSDAYYDLSQYIVSHQLPLMLSNTVALKPNNVKKEISKILKLPMIQDSLKNVTFYDKGFSRGIRLMIILIKMRQFKLLQLFLT